MSRVGSQPIEIKGTQVEINGREVEIKGAKGSLTHEIPMGIKIEKKDDSLLVTRENNTRRVRSLHGLTRSILANMVQGVSEGWTKELEVQGTGFRAEMQGPNLVLSLGFSHQVTVEPAEGTTIAVEDKNKIVVTGADKVAVGNMAAKIRAVKKPDAYKGKGIRYLGEVVHLKPGKAGKVGAAGGAA